MTKIVALVLIILSGLGGVSMKKETSLLPPVQIVPMPLSIETKAGKWEINKEVDIVANNSDEKNVAGFLAAFLKTKNIAASIVTSSKKSNKIELRQTDLLPSPEGYVLVVTADGVTITTHTGAGLFYGAQSLMQVFPTGVATGTMHLPLVTIKDSPRFAYRGLHLDVGRNMFSVEFIKKYIDLMAHHKYNRFHWHLTEDQGWRIEIKKYPRLQQVGAYRKETVVGRATTRTRAQAKTFDGKRYGGYYTQEEVKEVVKYAADRYITVIPEIEMPGHSLGALAAYPNLGCTGGPYEVATTWGVFDDIYCAGKEETFQFLQDVLDEIMVLFPSKLIHIGGDESPKRIWEKCPHCQQRIKDEHLKDEHELQSYFIQRIEKYINSKGHQIIGWDEILEGGLAPNATVMSWRGEEGGIAAAKQNHDVIMSPSGWCYFDYYQDSMKTEPLAAAKYLPVSKVYSYEPVPSQLTDSEAAHILGVQGNVWSEYLTTTQYAEYMVYPRACALAEVAWSAKGSRDYNDFLKRMGTHLKRLDEWHVNYAKHIVKDIPKE